MLEEWDGYLLPLCGGRLFLADSRGRYGTGDAYEYEWFLWTGIGARQDGAFSPACYIKEYGACYRHGPGRGVPFFRHERRRSGEIESVWETRMETAGDTASRKTAHRRGAAVLLKTIPNSRVDISVSTDRVGSRPLVSVNMGGLDFCRPGLRRAELFDGQRQRGRHPAAGEVLENAQAAPVLRARVRAGRPRASIKPYVVGRLIYGVYPPC